MEETDWDEVVERIKELLEEVDNATTALCEHRFFKACTVIGGKVVPILKGLLREAEAKAEMRELAEEFAEKQFYPEAALTEEERAIYYPTEEAEEGVKTRVPFELPTFRGYTVDKRLKQFRKGTPKEGMTFIDFDSDEGIELLSEMEEYFEFDEEE